MLNLIKMCVVFFSVSVLAGPGASGGGDELAAQFVILAKNLIRHFPFPHVQKTLLTQALEKSSITSTPLLLEKKDGQPVSHQEGLLAWSTESFIQLKRHTPGSQDASWEKLVKEKKPVAHQIAHELFRASGAVGEDGKSIDDNYRLSVAQFHLEQLQLFDVVEPERVDPKRAQKLLEPGEVIPNQGRILYCKNQRSEVAFVELENVYALIIRGTAFRGHVVSPLLDGIAPAFSAKSKGNYLQLSVRTQKKRVAPGIKDPFDMCQFSSTTASLIWCGLGPSLQYPMKLSDGEREEVLDDSSLEVITDRQITERVGTALMNNVVFHLTLYGNAHPFFKGGFHSNQRIDVRACGAR